MKIELASVRTLGTALARPECVLANAAGDLLVAHLGHGLMHIAPDGTQRPIGATAMIDGAPWIPNGFAWQADGSFLVANMGPAGGLWRLDRTGKVALEFDRIDGVPLGATNFVVQDTKGRTWVTVTTRQWPISKVFAPPAGPHIADGYVILIDGKGPRVVADGLVFTNELRFDANETHAFVVETFGRRITRYRIGADGSLGGREVFARFGHGDFVDGAAFDAEGHLWVASIISNRLYRVAPDGRPELVLDETDAAHVDHIERRIADGTVTREDVQNTPTQVLKNIASVTFAGPDLKTVYLGSLGGTQLAVFRSPVAGVAPVHWSYRL